MANPFIPQRYEGQGAHTEQTWWHELNAMRGQKIGEWQTETVTEAAQGPAAWQSNEGGGGAAPRSYTRRYIDTQWGRLYDTALDQYNRNMLSGNEGSNNAAYDPENFRGMTAFNFGRFHNDSGSDMIQGSIDEHGVWQGVQMNRESNADMNTWLAIMATVGAAGYAGIGAGAAGAGAGEAGAAGAGAAGAGAAASGLSAAEIAQLALAAGSLYTANQARQGGGTTSVEPGDPTIEGPTPPPKPPVIDYADLARRYGGANAERTRNRTNLNPAGVTNVLAASGNLLLGA